MSLAEFVQFFDPTEEFSVWEGKSLPHWGQSGTICFVTWRTWDSIPQSIIRGWKQERDVWLRGLGINPVGEDWRDVLNQRFPIEARKYQDRFSTRWEQTLNEGRGACLLAGLTCRRIVYDSLLYFDGVRYEILDFVIMPNHVHLLAAFPSPESMRLQIRSWKRYTAGKINQLMKNSGRFWQTENFDHLVRSEEQYHHFRKYIAENPQKAGLTVQEFQCYSKIPNVMETL